MIIQLHEQNQTVASPAEIHRILQAVLASESLEDQEKEHFWVFMLSTRNTIKALDLVSLGILDASIVHPREVFRRAISAGCQSIIIAHNHPSGNLSPSSADLDTTDRLIHAGVLLGIMVLDHIIVSNRDDYLSMKESGHFQRLAL